MKEKFKKKLARSRLTWAGHADTIGEDKLAKRAESRGERRGKRSKMVMEDCLKET